MPNLTQFGNQRIEILVKKEGGTATETNIKEKRAEDVGGENENFSFWLGTANPKRKARVIKTNATHFVAVTKQLADFALEYNMSGLGYLNGDQAYQDVVSRRVETIKDTANVASSVAMGAVYGSWGGPIGTVLGMTFAAATTGVSVAMKYKGREREYDYKMFKEQNAIQYNRARAGINITNGRLR